MGPLQAPTQVPVRRRLPPPAESGDPAGLAPGELSIVKSTVALASSDKEFGGDQKLITAQYFL